jgi:hypothetical protein
VAVWAAANEAMRRRPANAVSFFMRPPGERKLRGHYTPAPGVFQSVGSAWLGNCL